MKQAVYECEKELKRDKYRLTDYVPYKLLYPFFDVEGMEEGLSYRAGEIIAYIGLVCFVLCSVLTVVSGVNYLVKNKKVLKDKKTEEGEGENS